METKQLLHNRFLALQEDCSLDLSAVADTVVDAALELGSGTGRPATGPPAAKSKSDEVKFLISSRQIANTKELKANLTKQIWACPNMRSAIDSWHRRPMSSIM